jgi:hypothetical protein
MNILKIKVLNNDYSVVFFNNASEGVFKVKCDIFLNTDKCRVLRGSSGIFGKQVNICNQAFIFTIYLGYDLSSCENVMKCLNEREIIVQKWNVFAKYFMNDWNKMYEYMMNNVAFDFIDLDSNVINRNFETNKQQVSISSNNTFDNKNSITSTNKSVLDNLINLALADGEVTEKERAIILRKAESLGEDKDEIEMILEGKISLMKKEQLALNSQTPIPTGNKEGIVVKCPSCGDIVPSFTINCKACGHEFRGVTSRSVIVQLQIKLKEIEDYEWKNNPNNGLNGTVRVDLMVILSIANKQTPIIEGFLVPNTKEDILEFLSLALPIGSKQFSWFEKTQQPGDFKLSQVYKAKAQQCIMKARIAFANDIELLNQIKNYSIQLGFN